MVARGCRDFPRADLLFGRVATRRAACAELHYARPNLPVESPHS